MVAAVPGAGVLLTRGTAVHLHGEAEKEVDGYDGHPDALADGRRGQAAEAEAREENSVLGPREHRVHRLGAATAIVRKSVTADQPMARPTCRATVGQYLASSTLSSLVGYCRRSLQTQNLGGTSKQRARPLLPIYVWRNGRSTRGIKLASETHLYHKCSPSLLLPSPVRPPPQPFLCRQCLPLLAAVYRQSAHAVAVPPRSPGTAAFQVGMPAAAPVAARSAPITMKPSDFPVKNVWTTVCSASDLKVSTPAALARRRPATHRRKRSHPLASRGLCPALCRAAIRCVSGRCLRFDAEGCTARFGWGTRSLVRDACCAARLPCARDRELCPLASLSLSCARSPTRSRRPSAPARTSWSLPTRAAGPLRRRTCARTSAPRSTRAPSRTVRASTASDHEP